MEQLPTINPWKRGLEVELQRFLPRRRDVAGHKARVEIAVEGYVWLAAPPSFLCGCGGMARRDASDQKTPLTAGHSCRPQQT